MATRFSWILFLVIALIAPSSALAQAPALPDFAKEVQPVLTKYCITCHGGAKPKGGFAIDKLAKDQPTALKDPKAWEHIADQLRAGEMPPAGKPKPSANEFDALVGWIDGAILKIDCTKKDPGRVTMRRLNRNEYNNTVRDLLGIQFRPADDFPSDDVGTFDNNGDVLSLSPLLMEKYLAASEKIVTEVFARPDLKKKIFIKPLPDKGDKTPVAKAIVEDFAKRAFRRPVTEDEMFRLMKLVDLVEKSGDGTDKGIQIAMQAALVSPHFLFRFEKDKVQDRKTPAAYPIGDYELANRLSYFLWSSMPDAELFQLAGNGKIRDAQVLEQQVKRMLSDGKAKALTENFAGQWLTIRNLAIATPDPKTYPTFDEPLRKAMLTETFTFFDTVVKEDRSILDFLDGDFTFVNERLAKHYGISGVKGTEFRKISLKDTERAGILTHASILTVTSNPTRTSPVKRGKWILDNLLNAPPPPPPPDVDELPDGKEAELKGSLRQRMEQHRSKALCASCHQRMDPIGFGFENFDGIGAFRTKDGKFPIDSSGTLPTGQSFKGPKDLVQVLKTTKEADFRRCLTEKLLIYALGRELEPYDKCVVEDVSRTMQQNENRFSVMVLGIVKSDAFQPAQAAPLEIVVAIHPQNAASSEPETGSGVKRLNPPFGPTEEPMTMNLPISRRTALKGLGVSVALPLLEAMRPVTALASTTTTTAAAAAPRRMLFVYVPNGVLPASWTPTSLGTNFTLPATLEPLAPFKDDLLVLSGLTCDKARPNGDGPGDHARAMAAFLTGSQARKTNGSDIRAGVSVDQLAAQRVGGSTRFPSLEIGLEGGRQAGNCDSGYSCAYSSNLSWRGEAQPLPKEVNPRAVFDRLFGNNTAGAGRRALYNQSILDFVMEDAQQLNNRVGINDQRRVDEYLSSVREIERRLQLTETTARPVAPGMTRPNSTPGDMTQHARLLTDVLVLAFQADLTRISTFVFANEGSNRNYRHIGVNDGHHDMTHHQNDPAKKEKVARINRYHMELFAHLVGRLRSVREGNGTLLDNCMVMYGSGNGDGNRHNHDELPILLVGKGGGTINSGRHVRYPRNTPLTNLYISMLERMGVQTTRFGDSTGRLSNLT